MLNVRAIKKFHDAKGILIGYTIQDETGAMRNVYKDQLKQAVASGKVRVVNMTLTRDGRFIGKAAPEPKKKAVEHKGSGVNLLEVYTNGKNLVGGLVDNTELHRNIGITHPTKYDGLVLHQSFDVGHELTNNIKHNYYDNIKIVDGKPDMSAVKRKSFSKVRDKLFKILKDNGIMFTLKVEKATNKYEYAIIIEGYGRFADLEPMVQAIYCLIEDACTTEKIKVTYIDEDAVYVENITGINDVRKAIKNVKVI